MKWMHSDVLWEDLWSSVLVANSVYRVLIQGCRLADEMGPSVPMIAMMVPGWSPLLSLARHPHPQCMPAPLVLRSNDSSLPRALKTGEEAEVEEATRKVDWKYSK